MNKIAISFAAAASALLATAATAAPLIADQSTRADSNIQNVRMVCNKTAVAGANAANARSFANPMATLPASVTSSAAVMTAATKNGAESAFALPA